MPFLLVEILNFQGSAHLRGVGSFSKVLIDYLWSLWGKARFVYDGEEMEQHSLERYLRMKENMRLIH